jgi:hypothetical protein
MTGLQTPPLWRQTLPSAFSLFTSTGTLICCALPALFVTLGMGATLAGLVSAAPWLITISKYKVWVFAGAGVMLVLAAWLQYRARHLPCPADARLAVACARTRRVSWIVLGVSVAVYATGFFFAFLADDLLV